MFKFRFFLAIVVISFCSVFVSSCGLNDSPTASKFTITGAGQ